MRTPLRIAVASLLLALITFAIYSPARHHGFVNFDDTDYVTQNPRVQSGFSADTVRWAFTTSHAANWHPLTWLSHVLDVRLFGLRAGGHHAVSVAVHAANAVLLFVALRAVTGAFGASLLAAALFAAHPLRVESVAWVAERKDLLAGCFWIAGVGAWVSFLRRPAAGRYLFVVCLLVLGLLSKPTMVAFPLILLLLDWWPLGRFGRGAVLLLEKTPLLLLSAASATFTVFVQRSWGAMDSSDLAAPAVRLGNAAVSAFAYLGQTLWPQGLAVFYPHPAGTLPWWLVWAAAAALAAVTLAALGAASRRPWLATGWLWFLVALAPMSGLIQVGTQGRADRYTYLALIGPVWALAWEAAAVSRRRGRALLVAAAGAAAVLALSVAARHQVGFWKDSETLFRHALAVTGSNPVAEKQLAGALAEQGRLQEALDGYLRVLQERPGDARIYNNIGHLLAGAGRLEEAEASYRAALRLRPSFPEAHNNLGIALGRAERHLEAVAEFREALRLRPAYPEAHLNLGSALALAGKMQEAIAETKEALRLDPRLAMAHNNLGVWLERAGKRAQAIAEWREALRLDPGCEKARSNLAGALAGTAASRSGPGALE